MFEHLHENEDLNVKFMVMETEIAPTTGTPHIQGYVHFGVKMSWPKLRKFKACYWSKAKGTDEQCDDYCSKDYTNGVVGCRHFRWGEMDSAANQGKRGGEARKAMWDAAKNAAIEGKLDEVPSDILISHLGNLKKLRNEFRKPQPDLDGELGDHFVWIHGSPRCGKSSFARAVKNAVPGRRMYVKITENKWWDDYDNENLVLIDDFSKETAKCLGAKFKNWFDRYGFRAEVKGCSQMIRFPFGIITSNYRIDECEWLDTVTMEAVKARFREIDFDKVKAKDLVEVARLQGWHECYAEHEEVSTNSLNTVIESHQGQATAFEDMEEEGISLGSKDTEDQILGGYENDDDHLNAADLDGTGSDDEVGDVCEEDYEIGSC